MSMTARTSLVSIVLVMMVVAGCAGAAPAGSGASASPARTGSSATAASQPTAAGQPTATQGGVSGLTQEDFCKLIPDAMWNAFGTALKVAFIKNADTPCDREVTGGFPSATVSLTPARDDIKAIQSVCTPTKPISGLGDEAVWCPSLSILTAYANGQTVQLHLLTFDSGGAAEASILAAEQAFVAAVIPLIPNPGTPIGGPGDNKACQLSNPQELEASFNEPFDAAKPDTNPLGAAISACDFPRRNAIGQVTFRIYADASQYDETKQAMAAPVEDVPGVGDKAFWATDLKFIEVACGGKMIDVQIVFLDKVDVDLKTPAATAAKAACTRL